MERVILDELRGVGITVAVKDEALKITDVASTTYIKGVTYDIGV